MPFYGGEKIPCMMYSAKWKVREQGVTDFISGMEAAMDQAVKETAETAESAAGFTNEMRCN